VFRAEERGRLDTGRGGEQIDRRGAVACATSSIREQSNPQAGQGPEAVRAQHVDAGEHRLDRRRCGWRNLRVERLAAESGITPCGVRTSVNADATIVATAREAASRRPFHRDAGDSTERSKTPVAGSIHIDVPVKPVWPNDPSGRNSPRLDEYDESRSQPSPRTFGSPAGVAGDVMRAMVSGASTRALPIAPPPSIIRAKRVRSPAVEKTPAWPATPPIRRAVGSCTRPRNMTPSVPRHDASPAAQGSVGAMRGINEAGGRNVVAAMPSGVKIRSRTNASRGRLLTRLTMSPSTGS
jgi:hypothetical protein